MTPWNRGVNQRSPEADLVHARQLLESALSQRTLELSETQELLKAAKAVKSRKVTRSPPRKPPAKGRT